MCHLSDRARSQTWENASQRVTPSVGQKPGKHVTMRHSEAVG